MNPRPRRASRLGFLAILLLGALISLGLLWTAPQTQPEEKPPSEKIVQTISVQPRDEPIVVTAYGPVIPARKVNVVPQVEGRIVSHHPALVPGGYVEAGQLLVVIDPSDYKLALTEMETAWEEARFELEVEKGRQVVALREWRLLQDDLGEEEVNQSLVLREPHLRRTEAMVAKATNEIAKARLNLSRTSIAAPYNAMVLEESVEIGQVVSADQPVCQLVGTDEFWVQATLPIDKLSRIRLPAFDQPGADATVLLDTGDGSPHRWSGTVIRLLSDLDPTGRMARLLIRVPDPLGLKSQHPSLPLLLGSYVQVHIDAGQLTGVLVIPRTALRENNHVWVADSDNRLRIHSIEILWTRHDSVIIHNVLAEGERLIVGGLKTALPGMRLSPQPLDPDADVQDRSPSQPGPETSSPREIRSPQTVVDVVPGSSP